MTDKITIERETLEGVMAAVNDRYRWHPAIERLRAALAAQPADAQQDPVAWKHDCAGLCTNDVELWIDACPHCGKPRPVPPAPAAVPDLEDALAAYWDAAYTEGQQGRTHDTPDGAAQTALNALRTAIAAAAIRAMEDKP